MKKYTQIYRKKNLLLIFYMTTKHQRVLERFSLIIYAFQYILKTVYKMTELWGNKRKYELKIQVSIEKLTQLVFMISLSVKSEHTSFQISSKIHVFQVKAYIKMKLLTIHKVSHNRYLIR